MCRSLVYISFVALVLLVPAATGQDSAVQGQIERFELFNACRPMRLVIEGLPDDASTLGLTKEALQAAAESRLRAARLYTEDMAKADYAFLYVNVNVVGKTFNILVEYEKILTDRFGVTGKATTWESGGAGTHDWDTSYIVSNLSRYLDKFLAAYLRVNEPACASAPATP